MAEHALLKHIAEEQMRRRMVRRNALKEGDPLPFAPTADEIAEADANLDIILNIAANYLDTYAGGHYMAKSCAQALRGLL